MNTFTVNNIPAAHQGVIKDSDKLASYDRKTQSAKEQKTTKWTDRFLQSFMTALWRNCKHITELSLIILGLSVMQPVQAETVPPQEDPCYYIAIYGYSGNGICDTTRAASINRYVSIQIGENGEWQACTYNTKLDLSNGNDAAKCITPLTDIDVKGNVSVWTRKAGGAWNINSVPSSYDPKYSCPPNQNWTYSSSYRTCSRPDCNPTTQVRDKATGTCVARPPIKVLNIHSDHLNTPRLLTDSQGEKVWEISPVTEPFGSSIPDEDPRNTGTKTTFNLRFPGQYFDKETNTHYNYYRDNYIPALGRYGQSDPIGLAGGINTYVYVGGNPLMFADPYGLVRWGDVGRNGLGLLGSGAGIVGGGMLMGAPTGITQFVGFAVATKSLYSWGTNWYGLARALSDDDSYDIPSNKQTLPRNIASQFSCSKNADRIADMADLGLDLAAGRVPLPYASNPGYKMLPGFSETNQATVITNPGRLGDQFSKNANTAINTLQAAQAIQYADDARR